MGSEILQYTRDRFPNLADVPDNELTMYVGDRFPGLLEKDSQFKSEYEQYKRANTSSLADFGESFVKGLAYDFPASIASAGEGLLNIVGSEYAKTAKEVSDAISKGGEEYAREAGINPDSWGTAFGSGAASLVPILATGPALGAVGASAKAAQAGVYGLIGLQSFGGKYKEAKDAYVAKGMSEEDAHTGALVPAFSSAVFEIGFSKLFGAAARKSGAPDIETLTTNLRSEAGKKAIGKLITTIKQADGAGGKTLATITKGSGPSLRKVGTGAFYEGAEEGAIAIADSIAAVKTYAPELTLEETTNAVVKNFVVGAGLGGAVGGVAEFAGKMRTDKQVAEVEVLRKVAPVSADKLERRQYENLSSLLPDDGEAVLRSQQPEAQQPATAVEQVSTKLDESGSKPKWWNLWTNEIRYSGEESVDEFINKFIPDFTLEEESRVEGSSVAKTAEEFSVNSIDYEGDTIGYEVARKGKTVAEFNTREEADAYVAQVTYDLAPNDVKQKISDYQDLARSILDISKAEQTSQPSQPNSQPEATAEQLSQLTGVPVDDLKYAGVDPMSATEAQDARTQQRVVEQNTSRIAKAARRLEQRRAEERRTQLERSGRSLSEATSRAFGLADRLSQRQNPMPMDQPSPTKVTEPKPQEAPNQTEILEEQSAQQKLSDVDLAEIRAELDAELGQEQDVEAATPEPAPAQPKRIKPVKPKAEAKPVDAGTPKRRTLTIGTPGSVASEVDIDGPVSAELAQQIEAALKKVKRSLGTLAQLHSLRVHKLPNTAGVASAARSGIINTIFIDPDQIAEAQKVKGFSLAKALEEEILHNLDGWAMAQAYYRGRKEGTVPENQTLKSFIEEHYLSIARTMPKNVRAEVRKLYGQDFTDEAHMAQEYVRMLLQKKLSKQTTEEAYRNPMINRLLRLLRAIFRGASNLQTRLGKTKLVQQHLASIESVLDEMSAAAEADSISKQEKAAASKKRKQDAKEDPVSLDPYDTLTEDQRKQVDDALVEVLKADVNQSTGEISGSFLENLVTKIIRTTSNFSVLTPTDVDEVVNKLHTEYRSFLIEKIKSGKEAKFGFALRARSRIQDKWRQYGKKEEGQINRRDGKNISTVSTDATTTTEDGQDLGLQIESRATNEAELMKLESLVKTLDDELDAIMSDPEIAEDAGFEGVNAARNMQITFEVRLRQRKQKEVAQQYGLSPQAVNDIVRDGASLLETYVTTNPTFRDVVLERLRTGVEIHKLANNPFDPLSLSGAAFPRTMNFVADLMSRVPNLKTGIWKFFNSELKVLDPVDPNNLSAHINLHADKINADTYVNTVLKRADFTSRRLAKAIKSEFPKVTDRDLRNIDLALKGNATARKNLPDSITEITDEMRQDIDNLTRYMKAKGWLTGDLLLKVEQKIGTYVARAYRIWEDPKWSTNIPQEVINRAINLAEQQLAQQGVPAAQVQMRAKQLIDNYIDYLADKSFDRPATTRGGRLGAKDLSLFKKRNEDLPSELRALMGEYESPIVNYGKTVERMARFIGGQMFLDDILAKGRGKLFFDKNDPARRAAGANEQIAGAKGSLTSATYSPLAGLYTTPLMNKVLNEFNDSSYIAMKNVPFMGTWVYLNSWTKYAKTLGSPMGQARNFIAQPFVNLVNGHNPLYLITGWRKIQMVFNDAFGTDAAQQTFYLDATRYGITGENLNLSEFRKVMSAWGKSASDFDSYDSFWSNTVTAHIARAMKQGKKALETAWRASDEFGKIIGWIQEQNLLRSLPTYANYTDAQIKKLAADNVRAGYPTYSEIPNRIQRYGNQPLVGPFYRFFYEMFRTTVNSVKIAQREINNGNYTYAARRIGGLLAVTTASGGVGLKILSALMGVGDDEQKYARDLMPDWDKNSQLLMYRDSIFQKDAAGPGEMKYINLAFNNPYSVLSDPLMTALGMYSQNPDTSALGRAYEVIGEFVKPFTSDTIATSLILGLKTNEDQYGNPIYNEEADLDSQAVDAFKYVVKLMSPGGIDRFVNRWIPAITGEELPSGEIPKLSDEIMNEALGMKIKTLDYSQQLGRSSKKIRQRINNANYIFNREAASKGFVDTETLLDKYDEANRSRKRIFELAHRQITAARLSGLSDKEIASSLKVGNLSADEVRFLLSGKYRAMRVSPSTAKKAKSNGHQLPLDSIRSIMKQYDGELLNETDE